MTSSQAGGELSSLVVTLIPNLLQDVDWRGIIHTWGPPSLAKEPTEMTYRRRKNKTLGSYG
jgi:hypothetical protein